MVSLMFASLNEEEREFVSGLFEKYGRMMYVTAKKILHEESDAADAVQETMYKIIKHIDQFEGDDRIRILTKVEIGLRTSVYNTACRQYRKKKRQLTNEIQLYYSEDEEEIPQDFEIKDTHNVEDVIIQKEECLIIRNALLTLSPALQDAVNLVYFCGMSQSHAADFLGIKEEALRNRIFHARKKLKAILEGDHNELIKE